MNNDARLRDADKHMIDGENHLKTSWFKWNPDHESAAMEFEKAGNLYKANRAPEQAKNAYIKAARSNAAKLLENAAMIAKELKQSAEAADLYIQASQYHKETGAGDRAGQALVLAAKCIEQEDALKALELYKQACTFYEADNAEHYGMDHFRGAVGAAVRAGKFEDALELQRRLIELFKRTNKANDLYKACLGLVVLYLANNDFVGADTANQECLTYQGYSATEESRLAMDLLSAFESSDETLLKKCIANQTLNFLDSHISRVARALKLQAPGAQQNSLV